MSVATAEAAERPKKVLIYRHSVLVRITHWINVVCILVLVMSGLQIFNAHPALYWGQQSHFDDPLHEDVRFRRPVKPARPAHRICPRQSRRRGRCPSRSGKRPESRKKS